MTAQQVNAFFRPHTSARHIKRRSANVPRTIGGLAFRSAQGGPIPASRMRALPHRDSTLAPRPPQQAMLKITRSPGSRNFSMLSCAAMENRATAATRLRPSPARRASCGSARRGRTGEGQARHVLRRNAGAVVLHDEHVLGFAAATMQADEDSRAPRRVPLAHSRRGSPPPCRQQFLVAVDEPKHCGSIASVREWPRGPPRRADRRRTTDSIAAAEIKRLRIAECGAASNLWQTRSNAANVPEAGLRPFAHRRLDRPVSYSAAVLGVRLRIFEPMQQPRQGQVRRSWATSVLTWTQAVEGGGPMRSRHAVSRWWRAGRDRHWRPLVGTRRSRSPSMIGPRRSAQSRRTRPKRKRARLMKISAHRR